MLERLLIASAIVLIGVGTFALMRARHMVRASGVAQARSRPSVLYFRSDNCGPCLAQGRYLQQVEAEFDGRVLIEKVDADVDQDTAARYGVFTLPTTIVIDRTGRVRHINYGLADARKLAQQLEDLAVA